MNLSSSIDNNDIIRIITDITEDPSKEAPDFTKYSQNLSKIIINSDPQFTVGIFGDWGTGKTTLMKMMQEEISKYPNIAQTIWFDSWRYEREEYSALVPLVRTIIIGIQNSIIKTTDNVNIKNLKKIQKHFYKIGEVILKNIELNLDTLVKVDMKKMIEDYQIEGSFFRGRDKIPFYEHISDRLQRELVNIREKHKEFRIVIFIDDLDRCTPERALELLESIKTFFDIKGIIYVIGMDPQTIDPIIQTKYGDKSKIDGMHYLEKIVQLPFQIPVWSSLNLTNMIETLGKKAGLSDSYFEEIQKKENQELIIKATQLNPRDIKRFINSIILAREVYGQDIKNTDKLIAVQAFYFHGYKWIKFLEKLIPYGQRVKFLTHFILLLEIKNDITSLDDLTKIIKEENYKEEKEEYDYQYKSLIETAQKNKLLNDIYSRLIEIDDNDLFTFLQIASKPLLIIDKIENYLRIVDTTGLTIKEKDIKIIDSQELLKLLQNEQVTKFNDYRKKNENIVIHLPYADLQERQLLGKVNLSIAFLFKAKLSRANLSYANLSEAKLSGADMQWANLSYANLSYANLEWANLSYASLFKANLPWAKLEGANLEWADLPWANLSGADLPWANLSGAKLVGAKLSGADMQWANLSAADLYLANLPAVNLSEADLSEARLSRGNLPWAKLSGANLSEADLSGANLSNANLSMADLTNSILINNTFSEKTIVSYANFENAIIDSHEFLEYLRNNKCINIPGKQIKNKQELRLELESRKLDQDIPYLLDLSKLPS